MSIWSEVLLYSFGTMYLHDRNEINYEFYHNIFEDTKNRACVNMFLITRMWWQPEIIRFQYLGSHGISVPNS
jgi:hypothetical protein